MNHLSLVKMQQDLQRAGEMVKGLNRFVEGKNGSQEYWNGALEGQEKTQRSNHKTGTARTLSMVSSSPPEKPQPGPSLFGHQSQQAKSAKENGSVASSQSKTSEYLLHPRERKLSLDDASGGEPASLASLETKLLFSRASGLIREALGLDGMVFIDACFRDISVIDPLSSTSGGSSPDYRFRGSK